MTAEDRSPHVDFHGRKVIGMAISGITNSAAAAYAAEIGRSAGTKKSGDTSESKKADATKASETSEAKKSYTNGRTVGDPKLSEKAAKYYEQLKSKYGDMEFVLVSKDKMEEVKANAAAYGSANKTVVLIDEEKLERMAEDEAYRKKYEGIIENGRKDLKAIAEKMTGNSSIKGFGMQVNDNGTVSFFAAMEKSSASLNEKLAEKRAAKKAEAKAAEKKAGKKEASERLKNKIREKSSDEQETEFDPKNIETITANSVDELLKKIEDFDFAARSDSVMTEYEQQVGGSIDFKG